jgi:hypothetical protein
VADDLFRDESQLCDDPTGADCLASGTAYQRNAQLGDVRFRDVNGFDENGDLTGEPDGIINAADRAKIGSPWADYQGGWTNTMTFRGLDVMAFFQFSQGNDVFNGMRFYYDNPGGSGDNVRTYVLDRWSPENPDGTHPRVSIDDLNNNGRASSRFVEDGSYVRLKNVVLGYSLPESFAGRMGFNRLRVYVQGQNLATWTDYTGFDPEVNYAGDTSVTRGFDFYTLPQARTISVGLDVGL